MRSVENKTHEDTSKGTGNGDSSDPSNDQKTDSLEVDGLECTITESDTDGSTGDTHGGGNWEGELGEDEDGNGGTHLHGGSSARGVVGDLVAHD